MGLINWSIQNEVKKQVNKEANYEWAKEQIKTFLPKYTRPKIEPLSAGLYNMLRQILP